MAVALLEEWCKIMGVDVQNSLLVIGIPVDCGDPEIRTVLQEVLKCVSSYQLLGKIFQEQAHTSVVLLELMEDTDMSVVPREVQGKGGVWKVIFKTPNQVTEFLQRLNLFLEKEGQTVAGMSEALKHQGMSPATTLCTPPEFLVGQAMVHA